MSKTVVRIGWITVFLLYFAAVVWLYFATIETDPQLPSTFLGIPLDKVAHFLMFLPFPVLGTIAFREQAWWRTLCWTTLAANFCAFLFESQQHRINPYRYTQSSDLNANLLGITVGLLIMVLIGLITKKK